MMMMMMMMMMIMPRRAMLVVLTRRISVLTKLNTFQHQSKGDLELTVKCVEAMNAKSDPSEEDTTLCIFRISGSRVKLVRPCALVTRSSEELG